MSRRKTLKEWKKQCEAERLADDSPEGIGYWLVKEEALDDVLALIKEATR